MKEKLDYPLALMVCMFKPPISTKRVKRGRLQTPKSSQRDQKKVQGVKGNKSKASGRAAMACRRHPMERP